MITVRHGEASSLTASGAGSTRDPELLKHGAGSVLHAILDNVVDDYQPALDGLDNDIDEVEDAAVLGRATSDPTERIYKLKREVLSFRKARPRRWSSRSTGSPAATTARSTRGSATYFRDVNDHLLRAVRDQLDADRATC